MADDFTRCMLSNSRMAARAVTRRYDAYLRSDGLTAVQYSLLGAVAAAPGATVSALAEAQGFERTTLTRNLDKLEASGLIVSSRQSDARGRTASLTRTGRARLAKLLPLWRQAQAELQAELSAGGFDDSLRILKRLATV